MMFARGRRSARQDRLQAKPVLQRGFGALRGALVDGAVMLDVPARTCARRRRGTYACGAYSDALMHLSHWPRGLDLRAYGGCFSC